MKKRVALAVQLLEKIKIFKILIFCILTYNYNYSQSEFVLNKLDSLNKFDSLKLNINSQMIVIDTNHIGNPVSAKIYNVLLKDIQNKVLFDFKKDKYVEYLLNPNNELITQFDSNNIYDLIYFKRVKNINYYFDFFKTLGFDKEFNIKEIHTVSSKTMIVKENSEEIFRVNFEIYNKSLKTVNIFEEGKLQKQYFFNNRGFLLRRINHFYKDELMTYYLYH